MSVPPTKSGKPVAFGITPDGDTVEVRDDGSTGHKIDKVYAILSVDEAGGEGIMGFSAGPEGWLPMVSSSKDLIEKLAKHAEVSASLLNRTAVMVEFSTRTHIRTIYEAT